jgi:soluble lytic murein transglycosylase-like protein
MKKIIFAIFISIMVVFLIIGTFKLYGRVNDFEREISQQILAESNLKSLYKLKVANWVAKNSNQITYKMAKYIAEEALKVKHPLLVLAVVSAESEFNPSSVSYKGAIGLGQIMPIHWEAELIKQGIILQKRDLFGVKENLMATSYILDKYMTQSEGDVVKALKLYLGASHYKYSNKVFTAYVSLSALKD